VVEHLHHEKISILRIRIYQFGPQCYQINISNLRGAISSSALIVNKLYTSKLKYEGLLYSMVSLFSLSERKFQLPLRKKTSNAALTMNKKSFDSSIVVISGVTLFDSDFNFDPEENFFRS